MSETLVSHTYFLFRVHNVYEKFVKFYEFICRYHETRLVASQTSQ